MTKPIPDLTAAEITRFHSKVSSGPGCMPWTKGVNRKGYGRFEIYRGGRLVRILAHRLAYFLATGEDPGLLDVRHSCDNPPCCNPEHLSTGTRRDNMQDAVARGRINTAGLAAAAAERTAARLALLETGLKRCSRCKETKGITEFNRNRVEEDGMQNECRPCKAYSDQLSIARRAAGLPRRGRRRDDRVSV